VRRIVLQRGSVLQDSLLYGIGGLPDSHQHQLLPQRPWVPLHFLGVQNVLLVQQPLLCQLLVLRQRLCQQVRQWCGLHFQWSVSLRTLRLCGNRVRVQEVLPISRSMLMGSVRVPSNPSLTDRR